MCCLPPCCGLASPAANALRECWLGGRAGVCCCPLLAVRQKLPLQAGRSCWQQKSAASNNQFWITMLRAKHSCMTCRLRASHCMSGQLCASSGNMHIYMPDVWYDASGMFHRAPVGSWHAWRNMPSAAFCGSQGCNTVTTWRHNGGFVGATVLQLLE